MGSKTGGHRGRRHRESLYSYRQFKLGHAAHRVIMLTGMPLQDGEVAIIQAHARAMKSYPKFAR